MKSFCRISSCSLVKGLDSVEAVLSPENAAILARFSVSLVGLDGFQSAGVP